MSRSTLVAKVKLEALDDYDDLLDFERAVDIQLAGGELEHTGCRNNGTWVAVTATAVGADSGEAELMDELVELLGRGKLLGIDTECDNESY